MIIWKKISPKNNFTVGIIDDVTFTSLKLPHKERTSCSDQYKIILYGMASDGTVTASKAIIKMIGEQQNKYGQNNSEYSADKSYSQTISYIRLSNEPIKSAYNVRDAHYIGCHKENFLQERNIANRIEKNGILLVNTKKSLEELEEYMLDSIKITIAKKKM